MPTILLIRHGDNDWVNQRLAGRLPGIHLNEKGRQQAEKIAQRLADKPVSAIYSSPIERAQETAAPLAKLKNLPVQIGAGLVEVDYGEIQGRTFKQLNRTALWKLVLSEPVKVRFPAGDTFPQAQARVVAEIAQILTAHQKDDLVACFTHADVVKLAVAHYLSMPLNAYMRLVIDTGSITALHFGKEGVGVLWVNRI